MTLCLKYFWICLACCKHAVASDVHIAVINFQPTKVKNGCAQSLVLPRQYKDVNTNPDSDCYLLRVTTLNFIFTSVVMGMTLSLVSDTTFTCTFVWCFYLSYLRQDILKDFTILQHIEVEVWGFNVECCHHCVTCTSRVFVQ